MIMKSKIQNSYKNKGKRKTSYQRKVNKNKFNLENSYSKNQINKLKEIIWFFQRKQKRCIKNISRDERKSKIIFTQNKK